MRSSLAVIAICAISLIRIAYAEGIKGATECSDEAISKHLSGNDRKLFMRECLERAAKTPDASETASNEALGPKRPAPPKVQAAVLAAIQKSLRDPDSAKLQDVNVRTAANGSGKVCGKVNAKNGYGGYTGFVSFIADIDSAGNVELRDLDSPTRYEQAAAACFRNGF